MKNLTEMYARLDEIVLEWATLDNAIRRGSWGNPGPARERIAEIRAEVAELEAKIKNEEN